MCLALSEEYSLVNILLRLFKCRSVCSHDLVVRESRRSLSRRVRWRCSALLGAGCVCEWEDAVDPIAVKSVTTKDAAGRARLDCMWCAASYACDCRAGVGLIRVGRGGVGWGSARLGGATSLVQVLTPPDTD